MGDRVYVRIRIKASDREAFFRAARADGPDFNKETGDPCEGAFAEDCVADESENDGIVMFGFEEVNYAGACDIDIIASRGVIFEGEHDAGDNYGSYCFVSDGREAHQIEQGYDISSEMAPVSGAFDEFGIVHIVVHGPQEALKNYFRAKRIAERHMNADGKSSWDK